MIKKIIENDIEKCLNDKIISLDKVSGGCINQAFQIKTESDHIYFVKINVDSPQNMFAAEAAGLDELRKPNALNIPRVIKTATNYLILENIVAGIKTKYFWEDFGKSFALLHKFTAKSYGFYMDNFLGSTLQINQSEASSTWSDFFFTNRLLFQFKLAEKNDIVDSHFRNSFIKLEKRINSILDTQALPSLLHGDLWSGNFIASVDGSAWLIDPAVYYGHREADLAMTKLFGGFNNAFYESYNNEFPLDEGYKYRESIYKLYHILNHLNLFGKGYYQQAISLMNFYLK
jgi:fructosamine-3-kinase